jgi:class 3 adenylate cyclase/TolB-like protein/cytochrome c-type biogenesis protein CcmH/NrfG
MTGPTRQLAVILFSDIVGYTALMGADENRALEILRQSRNIQRSSIEKHRGKWLKEMGDGVLAQFTSAVDAVHCSLEIQNRANSELEAKIRIGLHLGDVTVENEDVFGDGVNIASRIQAIADPGGIYISESINEAVHAQSDIKTGFLAEVELKNVNHPIKTYYVSEDWLPIPSQRKIRELSTSASKSRTVQGIFGFILFLLIASIWWINSNSRDQINAIAVLPITNLSGDPEVDVLMAGIHTNLRDGIAVISALRVPSRRSTAQYQESSKSIPEIADELGVDAVLESDVREIGDNIDLFVRLIIPHPEERQVWSASFKGETGRIMSIYNEIVLAVADNLEVTLTPEESEELRQENRIDPEAYKAYITGLNYMYELTKDGMEKSLGFFNRAIEIDSTYAPAYVGLSLAWSVQSQQGFKSVSEVGPKSQAALQKAMELGSKHPEVLYRQALLSTWGEWKWEEADRLFIQSIRVNPDHAKARAYYAHYLNIMQRFEESQDQFEEALRLEPNDFLIQGLYGMHLNQIREFDKVITHVNKTIEIDPSNATGLPALWAAYHNKGMYKEAFETAQKVYSEKREDRALEVLTEGYETGGYEFAMEKVAEAYILKRDTTFFTPWQVATLYTRANNVEKALEWLDKSYEEHDPNVPYISCDPIFDQIEDHPRFKELLAKMGLIRNIRDN